MDILWGIYVALREKNNILKANKKNMIVLLRNKYVTLYTSYDLLLNLAI